MSLDHGSLLVLGKRAQSLISIQAFDFVGKETEDSQPEPQQEEHLLRVFENMPDRTAESIFGDFKPGPDILSSIAVIGFSFKFPHADTPSSFWRMMVEKECAMTEWPKDRMNLEAFFNRDERQNGKV